MEAVLKNYYVVQLKEIASTIKVGGYSVYKCKHCGEQFETHTLLGGHVTKVHSIKVHESNKKRKIERHKAYEEEPTFCLNCKKELPYEKRHDKFCSHSCSATLTNQKRQHTRICLECDTEFNCQPSSLNKFCSSTCFGVHTRKKSVENWLETGELKLAKSGQVASKSFVKLYLLEEQKHCCFICGMKDEWNNKPINFVLDHINGDSTENKRENLRLICHNCDSQTDTYKGRNKGNGRRSKGFSVNEGL